MSSLPTNPSESFKRRNPHLYPAMGSMETRQPKHSQVSTLDSNVQKRKTGKGSVEIVVTLVTLRCRELDDDGNVAALKPIRDAVALSLGLDDADKRIRFEYGQCETRGQYGVMVKIERATNEL